MNHWIVQYAQKTNDQLPKQPFLIQLYTTRIKLENVSMATTQSDHLQVSLKGEEAEHEWSNEFRAIRD